MSGLILESILALSLILSCGLSTLETLVKLDHQVIQVMSVSEPSERAVSC